MGKSKSQKIAMFAKRFVNGTNHICEVVALVTDGPIATPILRNTIYILKTPGAKRVIDMNKEECLRDFLNDLRVICVISAKSFSLQWRSSTTGRIFSHVELNSFTLKRLQYEVERFRDPLGVKPSSFTVSRTAARSSKTRRSKCPRASTSSIATSAPIGWIGCSACGRRK